MHNSNNVNLLSIANGPRYIHPESDLHSRPTINSKADLKEMYPECFGGVGMFKDFEYEIKVDSKVKPVVHVPRRVPIALQPKLEAPLDEMEKKGIILKVEGFTPWTNSLVIQEKANGKLRICLDPKDLNSAIIDDPQPIPTLDDITHKLNSSTLYGKLDADSAYWNVKLTKKSSILTFNSNTKLRKYKFERLPFGVKTSQNTFQRRVDETCYAHRGAVGITDDI